MKRHSDEVMASADTVGAYTAATTRSPPRSRPNLVTISNVQSNFVSQSINNPNIQFNTVQPFSTPTMPVLAINDKISGSLPGGSSMPALHTIQAQQHTIQQIRQKVVPSSTIIQQQQQQQQTQFQRLKVEDALSYLDQVKFKFSNQPQVYNDFLDIMKEFKSQSIDTPGVITRVSNLFKGHPELIVGFNTFLPPGYKIEIKNNETGFHVSVSIPQSPAITSSQTIIHSTTQHIMSSTTPIVTTTPVTLTSTPPVVIKPAGHLPLNQVNTTSVVINHHTAHNSVTPTTPSSSFHSTQVPLSVASLSQVASNIPQVSIPTTQESTNSQNQPVEFNHAINYVNKIKNRFQGQPEKYKRFLEILHTYQKEQKTHKDNVVPVAEKTLTEAEVYQQVAKLFENQDDLLVEFGQFLPDAKTPDAKQIAETITVPKKTPVVTNVPPPPSVAPPIKKEFVANVPTTKENIKESNVQNVSLKRTSSFSSSQNLPPPKKPKSPFPSLGDVSYVEAYKYGTLTDFAFFDVVRKSIHNTSAYDDFLRCLVLYYTEIITKPELLCLVQPFLGKYSELFKRFKDFIGTGEKSNNATAAPAENKLSGMPHLSLLDPGSNRQDRSAGDLPTDIDFSICKRLGASYCAVPSDYKPPKCSGRTKMCYEVLNDTWVSFPTWSEESSFATSRKIQYEEYMHRCEDERFELDLVMEINLAAIYSLEEILRKFNRMTPDELGKFKLDDSLGTDPSITSTNKRAIKRLYGDKTSDILYGLKTTPETAIPIVLKRLKAKDEEWKEARNSFNEIWKSQNEKYYLKSLDHQGVNFKQSDMKFLRSKSLLNEIEVLYDERNEQSDNITGPHMVFSYIDKSILDDVANLLIHHVKRQASINKEDKQKIKSLIRRFIPDMFHHPRQELSDDEHDGQNDCSNNNSPETTKTSLRISEELDVKPDIKNLDNDKTKVPENSSTEECYTIFFGNNNWYLFLRLHHILCERLTQIYKRATQLVHDQCLHQVTRSESVSTKLRLNPKSDILLEDYYPALLDMIKNVLDGNMDSNTYEDTLREMFGIHAYVGFTLDKVVVYSVRQLQNLVSDEYCQECYNIFLKESKKNGTGGPLSTACQRAAQEAAYQRRAEAALSNDNNCYKIFIYKYDCKLTFELLDTDTDDNQDSGKWTSFDNEPLSETNDDKQEDQSPKD